MTIYVNSHDIKNKVTLTLSPKDSTRQSFTCSEADAPSCYSGVEIGFNLPFQIISNFPNSTQQTAPFTVCKGEDWFVFGALPFQFKPNSESTITAERDYGSPISFELFLARHTGGFAIQNDISWKSVDSLGVNKVRLPITSASGEQRWCSYPVNVVDCAKYPKIISVTPDRY